MSEHEHDNHEGQPDIAALLHEVQALRATVAAQTELLHVQAVQAAQRQAPQPRYTFMQDGDVTWTTPTGVPEDPDALRAAAIAQRDALLARAEEHALPVHPPKFISTNDVAWVTRDEDGHELTPAEVHRRAQEHGAEALRRQDELRALR